jgi:ribosomal protein S8
VLKDEGYIVDYQLGKFAADAKGHKEFQADSSVKLAEAHVVLRVFLKYGPEGERVFLKMDRASKPGRRLYRRANQLKPVLDGLGIAVISTSKGVMSDRRARPQRLGGELICTCGEALWGQHHLPAPRGVRTKVPTLFGASEEPAMSRIGKQPIIYPAAVKVQLADGTIRVEGPKGKLEFKPHPAVIVKLDDKGRKIEVTRPNDERQNRSLHGLTRSLIANMVEGVVKGWRSAQDRGHGYSVPDKKALS